jgi:hypothetical protein
MTKTKPFQIFLGVKTAEMEYAQKICEAFIGHPMECTNSTFYGGDHCHAIFGGGSFDLRLNHHDDGDGWSWCLQDARYPLVLDLYFSYPADAQPFLVRIKDFDLIVDTRLGGA